NGQFDFEASSSSAFSPDDSITISQTAPTISNPLNVHFGLSGHSSYSLSAIEGVYGGNFSLSLTSGATLALDDAPTHVTGISGDVSGTMQTSAAALDLSNFAISGVQIASTNAAGTTFTVPNLATAYEVAGGPGQDTLVANGFNFTDTQRLTIFGQQSV